MIIVAGTVRIQPGQLEAARAIMEDVITASRREEGCISYTYSVDVLDPHVVHVFEEWRDQAALEAHFATAHLMRWRAQWASFGISDRKLKRYEIASEQSL